ncbi:hypothetical protein N7447_001594 [Penicillium robsamsonii]|uniref:uncharacterized protein n=1 Tax=Penicillium robsamsonii TaxID=1792511 RepID=UPI00254856DF|nr:uncharacterized protein N7447_001594 [Penicillium robsamsonii]KAJ5835568.1 hypothetical protein N7447_001594 [Penicillium robsamsonii]
MDSSALVARLAIIGILFSSICWLYAPSTPPSSTDGQLVEGQRLPDGWHALHLDGSEAFNLATLEAITPGVNSTSTTLAVLLCTTITAAIVGVVWAQSKQKTCAKISGNLNGWKYVYYATGCNCDTTAQKETIHGALYHYLSSVEKNKVCGTQCLSIDHGGTYEGYMKLRKAEWLDANGYYNPLCQLCFGWEQQLQIAVSREMQGRL